MNIKMITSAPAPSSLTPAHTAAWQEQTVNMTQVKGRDKQISNNVSQDFPDVIFAHSEDCQNKQSDCTDLMTVWFLMFQGLILISME